MQESSGQVKNNQELLKAPNQVEFFFSGPSLKEGKKPLFLYFALSAEASLLQAPFNQPILYLNKQFPNIRSASITLPFHSKEHPLEETMSLWSDAFRQDPLFLHHFIEKISDALEFLIESEIADVNFLGLGGLSRGGYVATLLAAEIKNCKALVTFAPLTELSFLSEMEDLQKETRLKNLSSKLTTTAVRAYIGNRDLRVGTRNCFDWIESIVEEQFKSGIKSPRAELIISPSIGHKGHGTSETTFNAGAEWLGKQLS